MNWRRGPALALVVLLAGCASHPHRPTPRVGKAPAAPAADAGSRRGVADDLSRPQDRRYRDARDSVPDGPPPDVSKLPEPVPKLEPRSLYGNKSPYTVLGRTYRVLPTARGYDERGLASFYGSKFDGYKTSSLETYDMYAFSAAHKTLPLPSYARVTNLANGKSVIVRINDRGPFHPGRIIDLSYAAAVRIGIWPKGTGMVEVRGIDPAEAGDLAATPPVPAPAPAGTSAAAGGRLYLQVGAFGDAANAERLAERLRDLRLAPVDVVPVEVGGRRMQRVRLGPLRDQREADRASDRIEALGLPRPMVATP